jgi:hypothetical protein
MRSTRGCARASLRRAGGPGASGVGRATRAVRTSRRSAGVARRDGVERRRLARRAPRGVPRAARRRERERIGAVPRRRGAASRRRLRQEWPRGGPDPGPETGGSWAGILCTREQRFQNGPAHRLRFGPELDPRAPDARRPSRSVQMAERGPSCRPAKTCFERGREPGCGGAGSVTSWRGATRAASASCGPDRSPWFSSRYAPAPRNARPRSHDSARWRSGILATSSRGNSGEFRAE